MAYDIEKSALVLIETNEGTLSAENIYEGAEDFFADDAAAAYEFDDGRPDAYPLTTADDFHK